MRLEFDRIKSVSSMVVIALTMTVLLSCSDSRKTLYNAERDMFRANKLSTELGGQIALERKEFLDRTIDAYRNVVEKYRPEIDEVDGLSMVVATAQIELARLQSDAGRLPEAKADYELAYELAKEVPTAQMDALFTAATIAERMRNKEEARRLYTAFFDDFLNGQEAKTTAEQGTLYMKVPLRIAELFNAEGDKANRDEWLQKSESLYVLLGDLAPNTSAGKEARLNLLATYMQQGAWKRALGEVQALYDTYKAPADVAATKYLEAKIYHGGLHDEDKAIQLYRSVYEDHPQTQIAPKAMLSVAAMVMKTGDLDEAERLYKRILRDYDDDDTTVEAQWQLAETEERQKNYAAAVVRYRGISKNYQRTMYAFEAPLRVASIYERTGDNEARRAAFAEAIESYQSIVEKDPSFMSKVVAEEFIARAYESEENWGSAVEHLLSLPDKYPDFELFHRNYILVASIYERELKDVEKSKSILQTCIDRYPGSEVASEAKTKLDSMN